MKEIIYFVLGESLFCVRSAVLISRTLVPPHTILDRTPHTIRYVRFLLAPTPSRIIYTMRVFVIALVSFFFGRDCSAAQFFWEIVSRIEIA